MTKTPLTLIERSIIAKLSGASFPPATASKRFIRDLESGHIQNLSSRGREFLAYVAHRFRRQWKPTAAELAWVREYLATATPRSASGQKSQRVPPEYVPGVPRAELPDAEKWIRGDAGDGAVVDSAHRDCKVTQLPDSRRNSRRRELAHACRPDRHSSHSAPAQLSLF
ncbi:MAG: hypothetical protein ACRD4R_06645 [Candidatus Acidiferrales bacterium]